TTLSRFEMPAYSVWDASAGIARDRWDASLFVQNASNVNASTFTSTAQFIVTESVLRPRVIGVKLGYKF
ncbi:MAG: hypothetical protein NTZ79_10670, partial [Proteobacteria bacterium]|nr:hypothetical protein [Pseudomonadota bacterium]